MAFLCPRGEGDQTTAGNLASRSCRRRRDGRALLQTMWKNDILSELEQEEKKRKRTPYLRVCDLQMSYGPHLE